MGAITFRSETRKDDWRAQFSLWQRATSQLTRCWPSSMRNARALLQPALTTPGSRLYAERDNEMVGYIGWHPAIAWDGLGRAMPFGFPWTAPTDDQLASGLYSRMITQCKDATQSQPNNKPPDVLIQRFRASWSKQRAFMRDRGWSEAWRQQIWSIDTKDVPSGLIGDAPTEAVDAYLIASRLDRHIVNQPTHDQITKRSRDGWIDLSMLRVVCECDTREMTEIERQALAGTQAGASSPIVGAFNVVINGLWAEVQLFACDAKHERAVHETAQRCARLHGATEIGFVLDRDDTDKADRLKALGYELRDHDVYMTCDASHAFDAFDAAAEL